MTIQHGIFMNQKILVVDDEPGIVEALARVLRPLPGVSVDTARDGEEALQKVRAEHPHIIISDLRMPRMDGLELLTHVKELNESIQFVVISGHGTIDDAVTAVKKGAYDFIQKPFKKQAILTVVQRVREKASLLEENKTLKEELLNRSSNNVEWGKSQSIQTMLMRASQAARSEATILILGESGTGKEVLANYLYDNSNRNEAPFIKVNCAAIPENLLESELFGHKKGAFTGATTDRIGRFQEADGGTIFLDEIGELPMPIQAKLLRALQEGEVSPVGGSMETVNVRVIAATNRDLKQRVLDKEFREDLYYRLNVIPLLIPSLAHHKEDIPSLVSFFVSKICRRNQRELVAVSRDAMKALENYSWPGNIRELENTLERAIVFCVSAQITCKELPEEVFHSNIRSTDYINLEGFSLEHLELSAIRQSMQRNQSDKKRVADELGTSLRTLYRKLDRIQLDERE